METAAVALLEGYADPLGLLALDRHDYALAIAIIGRAQELRAQREKQVADYTAGQFARFLIPGLRKTLLAAIARALR